MEPFQLNSMEYLGNSTSLIQGPSSLTTSTMMEVDQVRVAILPSIIPGRLFITSRLRPLGGGGGGGGVGWRGGRAEKERGETEKRKSERERTDMLT